MPAKKDYGTITIKKYANRRLYDTSKSTYITLADISEMVHEGLDFVVIDAKSGEDLTHTVLAQIVLEQESVKPTMFPTDFMKKIIGMYGNGSMQSFMPNFLSTAMDAAISQQERIQENFSSSLQGMMPDMKQLEEINRRNMAMFENAFSMFNPFTGPMTSAGNDKDQKIKDLENKIQELQKELNKK